MNRPPSASLPRRLALWCLGVAAALLLPAVARAENWLHWRGPMQNGVSPDRDLPDKWSPAKAGSGNLVWKAPYGGRSTPLIMNGRVFIINKTGEGIRQQERVLCLDAETGKVIWQYKFNVFFTDIVSARLGWTNLAGDPKTGHVYAHGVQGLFLCLDGMTDDKDGKLLWSHSLTEEYGRVSGYGGRVNSPTIDEDLVIIGMPNASWGEQGRPGDRYLAMDKKTGVPVWWATLPSGIRGTYYSCPVIAVINGERLLITGGSGGSVNALKVRTGELVWSYTFGAKAINSSPVVDGNLVYIAHGEENIGSTDQGRIICADASKVKPGKPAADGKPATPPQPTLVWKKDNITVKFSSPIIHEGRLYVCNEGGKMWCLDARKKGKTIWTVKYGTSASGSPVWADGKIYVGESGPHFAILQPGKTSCKILQKQRLTSPDGVTAVEINGSPAIANGRIYFNTTDEMYCLGKPKWDGKIDPVPPMPKEPKINPFAKPAHLQVVPADVVLSPGGKCSFTVRAFNDKGQFLKEVKKAAWSLPKPPLPTGAKVGPPPLNGEVSDGALTVSPKVPAQFGLVLARVGDLKSEARVRVAPVLPYKQDFSKVPVGAPPAGWVNAGGKFVVVEYNGGKALKKTNTNPNPLVARARTYIGMPTLKDYTIQAEVMGTRRNDSLPDMGVVAQRYTLLLDGNKQLLRLTSWSALPRIDQQVAFPWKPDAWYHLKLTVEVKNGQGLVRGKVWPRGEKEPTAWTIEVTDPVPNREGSPALYGYSTGILDNAPGSEVFYQNVSVTPNKEK